MSDHLATNAARAKPHDGTGRLPTAGDGPSHARVYEAHREDLRRYIARSLGPDGSAADDVLHDVFVRVLAASDRLPHGGEERPWLFRIATNLVIDHHRAARHRRSEPERDAPAPGPNPEDLAIREDLRTRIRDAVSRLPDEQREVFLLREYAEVPFKEIARRTGAPLGTVLGRMHHAMVRIRKEVDGAAAEPPSPRRGERR